MPGLIPNKALGLIETVGLVGAIEACDAAAKSADVIISSAEVIDPALVTIKIFGELGAVQSAVEAGSNAAARIGQLLTAHIIPNPDDNLEVIMGGAYEPPGPKSTPRIRPPIRTAPHPKPAEEHPAAEYQVRDITQLEKMRVTELRNFARGIANLGIKGREISMADKETLLSEIKRAWDLN